MSLSNTYIKKPVVIEAIPVADICARISGNDYTVLPAWVRAAIEEGTLIVLSSTVMITTLEGTMTGLVDDMLIKGIEGELYPCKPDIFAKTYDLYQLV